MAVLSHSCASRKALPDNVIYIQMSHKSANGNAHVAKNIDTATKTNGLVNRAYLCFISFVSTLPGPLATNCTNRVLCTNGRRVSNWFIFKLAEFVATTQFSLTNLQTPTKRVMMTIGKSTQSRIWGSSKSVIFCYPGGKKYGVKQRALRVVYHTRDSQILIKRRLLVLFSDKEKTDIK